ncbi:MAG TPA: hypothetical protein VN906_09225 [Candidatus Sulfotelmatobacter sp.]|nr:hypothetical protein [Candidatus Sulfotelmatobacter sp.]
MLGDRKGIRLMIWSGPTIPTPLPPEVLASLTKVDVTNDARQGDGFQMTVQLSKDNPADYGILLGGSLDLFNRMIIAVLIGASLEVLIDGVITQHQLSPSEEPGRSALTVTGKDISVMLDLEEHEDSYPYQPDSVIVERLLLTYIPNGLMGPHMIIPTLDFPIDLMRTPQQHGTDFKFILELARRNGYVFYVEPFMFGVTRAYFGPENRIGLPQAALTLNMGTDTNLRNISFTNDSLAPVGAKGSFIEPILGMTIPIPAMPALRIPPLTPFPSPVRRTTLLSQSANLGPLEAAASAIAAATQAPEAVSGQGEIDSVRYGRVLRARSLVGVRGVGFTYDGLYYVQRVAHAITLSDYRQSFTLSRDGTGALLPVLPT